MCLFSLFFSLFISRFSLISMNFVGFKVIPKNRDLAVHFFGQCSSQMTTVRSKGAKAMDCVIFDYLLELE